MTSAFKEVPCSGLDEEDKGGFLRDFCVLAHFPSLSAFFLDGF
jgi:hypothetical protein